MFKSLEGVIGLEKTLSQQHDFKNRDYQNDVVLIFVFVFVFSCKIFIKVFSPQKLQIFIFFFFMLRFLVT